MIEVLVTDQYVTYGESKAFFARLDEWARQVCPDVYHGYDVTDVSDFSNNYDLVGAFKFSDRKQADWFYFTHCGRQQP